MRFGEKGVTLVELIVVVALFFVVLPITWYYINGSIEDSANINNKIAVQTSVNQLMNSLQKHVQEASLPITSSTRDVYGEAEVIAEDGIGKSDTLKIIKPNKIVITYEYDPETTMVKYKMTDSEGTIVDSTEYSNIVKFAATLLKDENGEVNGLNITVVGRIDKKSNYSLTNKYYTRNTM